MDEIKKENINKDRKSYFYISLLLVAIGFGLFSFFTVRLYNEFSILREQFGAMEKRLAKLEEIAYLKETEEYKIQALEICVKNIIKAKASTKEEAAVWCEENIDLFLEGKKKGGTK